MALPPALAKQQVRARRAVLATLTALILFAVALWSGIVDELHRSYTMMRMNNSSGMAAFSQYLRSPETFKFDIIIITVGRRRHALFLGSTLMYLYTSGAMKHAASVHVVVGDPALMDQSLLHNLKHFPDIQIHSVINDTEIQYLRDDKFRNSITTWGRAMRTPDKKGLSDYPALVLEDDVMLAPNFGPRLLDACRDAAAQSKNMEEVFIAPYVMTQMMPEKVEEYAVAREFDGGQPDVTAAVKYEYGCCTQGLFFSSGDFRRAYALALEKWDPGCSPTNNKCGLQDMTLNDLLTQWRKQKKAKNFYTNPTLIQHVGALSATFVNVSGGRYHRSERFPWREKVYTEDPGPW